MSVEHLAIVLNHSRATGTDKLVLLGIANHMGDGGAWPAVSTLARYANVRDRAVQKSLSRLIALGEVERTVQAGGLVEHNDYTRPNRYVVTVECPSWCDRSAWHRPRPGFVWDDELRDFVELVELPDDDQVDDADPALSTGDTPGMHETRDTPAGPGVPEDTGCPSGHRGGVPEDTRNVPRNDTAADQSVPTSPKRDASKHQRSTSSTGPGAARRPELRHVRDQLRRSTEQTKRRLRGEHDA